MFAQCPRPSELCWSNQEVNFYPVHSRMQEHRVHVETGDIPRVNFIEGASCLAKFCRPPKKGQEGKEANQEGPGQTGAGEGGTGSETEAAVSTRISTFWGTKGQRWSAPEWPRWEKGGTI